MATSQLRAYCSKTNFDWLFQLSIHYKCLRSLFYHFIALKPKPRLFEPLGCPSDACLSRRLSVHRRLLGWAGSLGPRVVETLYLYGHVLMCFLVLAHEFSKSTLKIPFLPYDCKDWTI